MFRPSSKQIRNIFSVTTSSSSMATKQPENDDAQVESDVASTDNAGAKPTPSPSDESSSKSDKNDILLSLSFNQDKGCLAVGTANGFRVCNISPFQETFRRDFKLMDAASKKEEQSTKAAAAEEKTSDVAKVDRSVQGTGIGHVEMLYKTNLLALVGGGSSPRYPPNRVVIYDDNLSKPVGELSFQRRVLNVKLRRDRICVALSDAVYVYGFSDYKLLDTIHTCTNDLGLLDINTNSVLVATASVVEGTPVTTTKVESVKGDDLILACLGASKGQVKVELYGHCKSVVIDAHDSALGALALTHDGSLLATTCEKGNVIRLFDTGAATSPETAGSLLRKFRRGSEYAIVSCLSFSLDGCWLSCASDRGTVHLFHVSDEVSTPVQTVDTAEKVDVSTLTTSGQSDSKTSVMTTIMSVPNAAGRLLRLNSGEESSKDDNAMKNTASSERTGSDVVKNIVKAPITAGRLVPGLLNLPKRYLLEGEESFAQVRNIPNPKLCAFVPNIPNTIAVVSVDDSGNGSLILGTFSKDSSVVEEKGSYHFFKKSHTAETKVQKHLINLNLEKHPPKKRPEQKRIASRYMHDTDRDTETAQDTKPKAPIGSRDIVIAMMIAANGYITYIQPQEPSHRVPHLVFVSIVHTITWIFVVIAVNKGDDFFNNSWKQVLVKFGLMKEEKLEEEISALVEGYASTKDRGEGGDKLAILEKRCPEATAAERKRFLVARNGDVDGAAEQLGVYIAWRKIYKIDELFPSENPAEEDEGEEDKEKVAKNSIPGPSTDDDEQIWEICSRAAIAMDKDSAGKVNTPLPRMIFVNDNDGGGEAKQIMHFLPARVDLSLASCEAYSNAVGIFLDKKLDRQTLEKIDVVVDMRGGDGWANPSPKAALPFIKCISGILGTNCPERLSRCILFPLPRAMSPLWKVTKAFLDKDTANKIIVCFGPGNSNSPIPSSVGKHLDQKLIDDMEKERKSLFVN